MRVLGIRKYHRTVGSLVQEQFEKEAVANTHNSLAALYTEVPLRQPTKIRCQSIAVKREATLGRATLKGEGANILSGWLLPCVCYTLGIGGPPRARIPFGFR